LTIRSSRPSASRPQGERKRFAIGLVGFDFEPPARRGLWRLVVEEPQ
jgi:hypothetical protein